MDIAVEVVTVTYESVTSMAETGDIYDLLGLIKATSVATEHTAQWRIP